jgi:hypothetical protein
MRLANGNLRDPRPGKPKTRAEIKAEKNSTSCISLTPEQIEKVYGKGSVSPNYSPAFPHDRNRRMHPRQTDER